MPTRIDLAVAAHPALVRYAVRLTGNAADAEDVVHDAYVRVLPILGSLDGDAAVVRVLYRTVRNRWYDLARRTQVLRLEPLPMEAVTPAGLIDSETPEGVLLAAERRRLVRVIVDGLVPHYREALVGRYWREDPAYERDPLKHRTLRARRRFAREWEQVA